MNLKIFMKIGLIRCNGKRVVEMRVVVLQAGKEDAALKELLTAMGQILKELQVEIKQIRLNQLPYYEGFDTKEIKEILSDIDQSVGVVVASRVELLSISGSLCTFFEYCSNYKGNKLFQKPLFALTSSDWRGEREAAEHILHVWDILGGMEFGKLGIYTPSYSTDKDKILSNVERMTEDFYRMIKQDRTPIKSSDNITFKQQQTQGVSAFEHKLSVESEKYSDTRSTQEKDIEDLANLFKKQLSQVDDDEQVIIPEPQLKTTRHMLSSLPHYFQGQYEGGFEAIIQYHLVSEEPYSGYIVIQNGDCQFKEGVYSGAEVELTAQEEVIKQILTKKITAQKAFMLGQLKVRGNFMFLPKLDQLFKAM